MLYAIGHVVEKNAVRETEKNGKRSKVMDVTLEDLEWVYMYLYMLGSFLFQFDVHRAYPLESYFL